MGRRGLLLLNLKLDKSSLCLWHLELFWRENHETFLLWNVKQGTTTSTQLIRMIKNKNKNKNILFFKLKKKKKRVVTGWNHFSDRFSNFWYIFSFQFFYLHILFDKFQVFQFFFSCFTLNTIYSQYISKFWTIFYDIRFVFN